MLKTQNNCKIIIIQKRNLKNYDLELESLMVPFLCRKYIIKITKMEPSNFAVPKLYRKYIMKITKTEPL